MRNKQSVSTTRKISWFTLIAFFVFSILPFPGQAAVTQTVGTDGRIIYTTDSDTDWDVANFDQVSGAVWEFNLLNGNLNVNVNSDHATTWSGKTDIFGPGILGIFNRMGFHTTNTAEINLHNADFIGAAMRLTDQGTLNSLKLQGDANGGYALNEGKVSGIGNVAFLGRAVENKGTIDLPLNRVTLAAGDAMTVGLSGDNLVSVVVDEATSSDVRDFANQTLKDQIANSGNITGHKITLDAKGIDSVFEKAINLKGEIKAVDVDTNDKGELVLMSMDDIYSKAILEASKMEIHTQGNIETRGSLKAGELVESGATFKIGGQFSVRKSHHDNVDKAITFVEDATLTGVEDGTGIDGLIEDDEDIVIDGVTLTLGSNFTLRADRNTDGDGRILMNEGAKIIGGGYNLTLAGSEQSKLREITGVNNLTFNAQTAGARFTLYHGIDISGDLRVNSGATFDGTFSTIVRGGDVTGDGVIDMTGGIFAVLGSGQFGGAQDWNFNELQFGDGENEATTYKTGTNDITIGQDWTINNYHTLFGGSNTWDVTWRGGALKDISQITAGQRMAFALSSIDGSVYAWGFNDFGQLGSGENESQFTPVKVKGIGGVGFLTGVTAISAGFEHAVALLGDKTVVAWGRNEFGQLGNNTEMGAGHYSRTAVQVMSSDGSTPLGSVKSISAGGYHTLALLEDKTAVGWGGNAFGQLGDGTNANSNKAVQVKDFFGTGALTNIAAISAGGWHSLALLEDVDKTVVAWGKNNVGQLGDGTNNNSNLPVYVHGLDSAEHLIDVTAISAGLEHSLALLANTGVAAWGRNNVGQLGTGAITDSEVTPVRVKGLNSEEFLTGVKSVVAGGTFSLALMLNKTVAAWGSNFANQLGDGTDDDHILPALVKAKGGSGNLENIQMISAGYSGPSDDNIYFDYGLALAEDGGVLGWGGNYYGNLGDGTNSDRRTPVSVYSPLNLGIVHLTDIIQIAASADFTLALRGFDGAVFSWGSNNHSGRLGDDSNTDRFTPVRVRGVGGVGYLTGAKAISAGSYHGLALVDVDDVYKVVAWGSNGSGQLGDGTQDSRDTVDYVKGIGGIGDLEGVQSISAGQYHNLALMDNGSVVAWGFNDSGALGNGTNDLSTTPVQVLGLDGSEGNKITAISAGAYHSLALTQNGTVKAWGYGLEGELGNNGLDSSNTPVDVSGFDGLSPATKVKAIATGSGSYHSLALLEDGSVWAWGQGTSGQLGNDSYVDNSEVPLQVIGLDGSLGHKATAIVAGGYHSLALLEDGTVASWGANWEGELGDNTQNDSATFVKMKDASGNFLTGVHGIAAGDYHSFTLFDNGTLLGVGANYYGQLGNNSTEESVELPVSPGTLVFSPFLRGVIDGVTYGTFNPEQSTVSYSGDVVIGEQSVATRVADGDYNNLILKNKAQDYVIRGEHATGANDFERLVHGNLVIYGKQREIPIIDTKSQGKGDWGRANEIYNLMFGHDRGTQSFFAILFGGVEQSNAIHLDKGTHNFDIKPSDFGGDQGVEDFRKAIFGAESKPLSERKDTVAGIKTDTSIGKISGPVKVVAQDGTIYDAKEGMNLQKGDQVWTGVGAKAELATKDHENIVKMEEQSALSVDKKSAGQNVAVAPQDLLQIAFGKVSVAVASTNSDSQFLVQIPTGISGMRG